MKKDTRIAIIGGGNMGGAIAGGLAGSGLVPAGNITVTARTEKTLSRLKESYPGIGVCPDNRTAVQGADIVIIAVKPWIIGEVMQEIRSVLDYGTQCIVSVVAGVPFLDLEKMADNGSGIRPALFRVIPNTAISLSESMTFISSCGASDELSGDICSIFSKMGKVARVPEDMMAAGTSLASCGIAFALKYIDASIQGGERLGFSEKEATEIVIQTMTGALALLNANGSTPQKEIDKVTTPGGLTFKGLDAMQKNGFTDAVISGLEQSR